MEEKIESKTFIKWFEDREGDKVTIIGRVTWKENSEGRRLVDLQYWPENKDLKESIEDFIYNEFGL